MPQPMPSLAAAQAVAVASPQSAAAPIAVVETDAAAAPAVQAEEAAAPPQMVLEPSAESAPPPRFWDWLAWTVAGGALACAFALGVVLGWRRGPG